MVGDALERLRELPAESVQCVVTSPPYWGLRDYGNARWEGGAPDCDHKKDTEHQKQGATSLRKGRANVEEQRNENFADTCPCGAVRTGGGIGLEGTLPEHIDALVAVFREVRRVLRRDGTVWLNYGDAYCSVGHIKSNAGYGSTGLAGGKPQTKTPMGKGAMEKNASDVGLKHKALLMLPARVALALQADGWWLRSEIVWHKPNPMPESVTDRPTNSHEKMFLLTRSARYFYDADAVRVPPSDRLAGNLPGGSVAAPKGTDAHDHRSTWKRERTSEEQAAMGSNLRNVWTIPTQGYREAHFATFPEALVRPCIAAGTSERGACPECGAPWTRVTEKEQTGTAKMPDGWDTGEGGHGTVHRDGREAGATAPTFQKKTTGWQPGCDHAADPIPCTVMDPFAGSGTVGLVAAKLNRSAILIELNPEYAKLAEARIRNRVGLFTAFTEE